MTRNDLNKSHKEKLHNYDIQKGNKHDTVQIWLQKLKQYISSQNQDQEQQKYKKNRIRNRFPSGLQGVWGVPGRK